MDLKVVEGSMALPFSEPNVRPGHEYEDIDEIVRRGTDGGGATDPENNGCFCWLASMVPLCLPLCCGANLINAGDIGLGTDNGKPFVLGPGWHFLLRPFVSLNQRPQLVQLQIQNGPVPQ